MTSSVVFIHRTFLNPRSWEGWERFFGDRGYRCLSPAWPLHEGEPAQLRERVPAGLGELSLSAVIGRLRAQLIEHPNSILVGHSVGGLIVQRLLSEGIGSLGVVICSVAPNRMLSLDWGFSRNSLAMTTPLKGDAPHPLDAEAFYRNFGNTILREESDAAYERLAMPDSRNILRDCLGDEGRMDLTRPHSPLLIIAADQDAVIPAELCEMNADAYTDPGSRTDFVRFRNRGHFICGQQGWESAADYIERWIQARQSAAVPATPRVGAPGTVQNS